MARKYSETELIRAVCMESYYDFFCEFWSTIPEVSDVPLIKNWHLECLCNEAQIVVDRIFASQPKEYDLVVNVPPGSSKSSVFSVLLDAWCKTKKPGFRFLGASYAQNLAQDLSRKTRDVIRSKKYKECFPWVNIRSDQDSKSHWLTDRGGLRYAIGSGGVVVGMHFDLIVIDDPIDPEGAYSEVEVKDVNRWASETLSQRKADKRITPTIIVMQRLAEEDLTGYKLKSGDEIKHICLPAEDIAEIKPPELKKFYVDGLLDPHRMPRVVLEREKRRGQYFYSSQYLENPVPLSGGMFQTEKIRIGYPNEPFKKIIRFWDKAATADDGAYSVGAKMGWDKKGRIWILDVVRGQWDSSTREDWIDKTAKRDGRDVLIGVEQEPGSGGKESAERTQLRLARKGYRVKIIRPQGDKVIRADPFSTEVNAGNVYLQEADWNQVFKDELKHFPRGKFKDQVDSVSGGYTLGSGNRVRIRASAV